MAVLLTLQRRLEARTRVSSRDTLSLADSFSSSSRLSIGKNTWRGEDVHMKGFARSFAPLHINTCMALKIKELHVTNILKNDVYISYFEKNRTNLQTATNPRHKESIISSKTTPIESYIHIHTHIYVPEWSRRASLVLKGRGGHARGGPSEDKW